MQKVNLLFVITKLELGGAQKYLLSLISHLEKDRFNIFLFTAKEGLLVDDALLIDGLKIKRSRFLERPINPLKDSIALYEIYKFIKKNQIDIVHTNSSKAGILGRLAARLAKANSTTNKFTKTRRIYNGVKVIIHTVHGWSFNDYLPFFERLIFIWLEKIAARFTDKLIVVSNYDKQKGLDNHIGNENKYILIRCGIDYSEFNITTSDFKKKLAIDANDLIVGMVSCLKPQKSPWDFIRLAFSVSKIIPNVKFLLIGDGALRKEIENLIHRFNLEKQVILTGWRRDIPSILSAIDVFVLTSLWEGLPVTVIEAMASSKPVVATNTGGIREVIKEGKTGFLLPPKDVKRMSEILIVLLQDERLRKQIGKGARDALGVNFTTKHMLSCHKNLYEHLISYR